MAHGLTATWLLRRARGADPAAAEPDLADLGTAFGLDLSMQPRPEVVAPRRPPAAMARRWWVRRGAPTRAR
jgi:hypothetical protein